MTYYKRVYRQEWKYKGNPRELLLYSILRLKLPRAFEVILYGLGAGTSKWIWGNDKHQPDIAIRYNGNLLCGIEVSGTYKPFNEIAQDGVWILPDKLRQAGSWGFRYIYAFILEAEFPEGTWLLWLPGNHLKKLKGRPVKWYRRYQKHLIPERYYATPAKLWNRGIDTLLTYIKALSEREVEL